MINNIALLEAIVRSAGTGALEFEEETLKALVFEAPEKPVIAEMHAGPQANEVLVRTKAVGICHSDYELLAGRYIIPISYPVTPGHEWCGEIVEVGRNVKA